MTAERTEICDMTGEPLDEFRGPAALVGSLPVERKELCQSLFDRWRHTMDTMVFQNLLKMDRPGHDGILHERICT
jgi:hypothetical protein